MNLVVGAEPSTTATLGGGGGGKQPLEKRFQFRSSNDFPAGNALALRAELRANPFTTKTYPSRNAPSGGARPRSASCFLLTAFCVSHFWLIDDYHL